MDTDEQVYAGAVALGAIAGVRAMSAPALVSQLARRGQLPVKALGFLKSQGAITSTALLAAGEVIADKFPSLPARTAPGPLAARAVTGALSGALLCHARKRSPWLGALYGGLGAVGAAFAAYHLRRSLKENLHVPDAVVAVAEDALVATTGWLVVSKLAEGGR